jgi:copper chaperone CopZ
MTLLVFTLFFFWTPLSHAATEEAVLSVSLQVDGMTCIGCEAHVQKALGAIPGVRSAKVSYKDNEALVTYEKEKVTVEQLIQAVHKAGYKAMLKTQK